MNVFDIQKQNFDLYTALTLVVVTCRICCTGLRFCDVRDISWHNGRDRIVVSTSRCGRDNPGSNPGHGRGCGSLTRHFQQFCKMTF